LRHLPIQSIPYPRWCVEGITILPPATKLRIDPALRLALGKDQQVVARQFRLSRLANDILGNEAGLQTLEGDLPRSIDTLIEEEVRRSIDWLIGQSISQAK